MKVVTRFAPSPTGFLHIGGARTALFNWLFARRHGGTFLLRIEDTDRARSTQEAVDAILDGMRWLGLGWDGEAVSQFARQARHAEVAHAMLAAGRAYRCYATQEELAELRARQEAERLPLRYDGRWRDRDPSEAPAGAKPVIRLKAPQEGETVVRDIVRGEVRVQNAQLDDMVLLRSDGTPTYMLAVVVDDHDSGVTHVVRGDDHFTNTFRQLQIYHAMGWEPPAFAHVPLIHGPDGAKLSKRHGALGVDAYREMGYLPEALRNYLLRLGWSHGDEEIVPTERALGIFDLEGIGRSPARFDFAKLDSLNGHYLREAEDGRLVELAAERLTALVGRPMGPDDRARLAASMPGLKTRAKTLKELAEGAAYLVRARPLPMVEKAAALLDADARASLSELARALEAAPAWTAEALEAATRAFAEARGQKLGKVAQPLRAALTGSTQSPPVFEVAAVLGPAETSARIGDALARG